MKKFFLVVPFACLMTACGDPSVEDLLGDPELLGKTMQECEEKMAQGKGDDSESCKIVTEAQKKMAEALYKNAINQSKK
jgi:hypothetical protein